MVDPTPIKRAPALPERFFSLAEHGRVVHLARPEPGTSFEALKNEAYWAHVARKVRPWDEILVQYQDDNEAYLARLLVRAQGDNWVRISVVEKIDLDDAAPPDAVTDQYEVKFMGPSWRWAVLRRSDGEAVVKELKTKGDAHAWLLRHVKAA